MRLHDADADHSDHHPCAGARSAACTRAGSGTGADACTRARATSPRTASPRSGTCTNAGPNASAYAAACTAVSHRDRHHRAIGLDVVLTQPGFGGRTHGRLQEYRLGDAPYRAQQRKL